MQAGYIRRRTSRLLNTILSVMDAPFCEYLPVAGGNFKERADSEFKVSSTVYGAQEKDNTS